MWSPETFHTNGTHDGIARTRGRRVESAGLELARINRELGGDFDLSAFRHHAFYNAERSRVEMHLVSERRQRVWVGPAAFDFRPGETIHTENSHKYDVGEVADRAAGCGLHLTATWTDERSYFAVLGLTARPNPSETAS